LNKNQLGKAHRKGARATKSREHVEVHCRGGSSRPIFFKGHKIAPYLKGSKNSNL